MTFLQKFMTDQKDLRWKPLASVILRTVGGMGLDEFLFLMDTKKLNTSQLPIFYKNIFKVWNLFIVQKCDKTTSLNWLLEEPLIFGTQMDLMHTSNVIYEAFLKSHLITL